MSLDSPRRWRSASLHPARCRPRYVVLEDRPMITLLQARAPRACEHYFLATSARYWIYELRIARYLSNELFVAES